MRLETSIANRCLSLLSVVTEVLGPCVSSMIERAHSARGSVIRFAAGDMRALLVQEYDASGGEEARTDLAAWRAQSSFARVFERTTAGLGQFVTVDLESAPPAPVRLHPWPAERRGAWMEGVPARELYEKLALLAPLASTDGTRPQMCGISLSATDGAATLVACNGHVLVESTADGSLFQGVPSTGCLLRAESLALLKKFVVHLNPASCRVSWEPDHVLLSWDGGYVALQGQEDNLSRAAVQLVASAESTCAVDCSFAAPDLARAVRQMGLEKIPFRDGEAMAIEAHADRIELSFGDRRALVPAEVIVTDSKKAVTIHVSPQYFARAAKATSASRLSHGHEWADPLLLRGASARAVVMPMRV